MRNERKTTTFAVGHRSTVECRTKFACRSNLVFSFSVSWYECQNFVVFKSSIVYRYELAWIIVQFSLRCDFNANWPQSNFCRETRLLLADLVITLANRSIVSCKKPYYDVWISSCITQKDRWMLTAEQESVPIHRWSSFRIKVGYTFLILASH